MNRLAAVLLSSFFCAFFCSMVAPGQNSATAPASAGAVYTRSVRFDPLSHGVAVVTGAPYSGEEVDETDQTLGDGTHITRRMPVEKKYRDSMGRTRSDWPLNAVDMGTRSDSGEGPMLIHIYDPVAHVRYILVPEQRIAYRHELLSRDDASATSRSAAVEGASQESIEPGSAKSEAGAVSQMTARVPAHAPSTATRPGVDDAQQPKSTSERLGTETIEGVLAYGTRITTTWPAGSAGNDHPFTTTREFWLSRELKLDMLSKTDDPRTGQRTRKLINVSRDEPDPALFQPPPGYAVKDETGEFSISWPAPQR